jgi:hypothetical protein
MEFCHTDIILHSPAAQKLAEFIQKRREQWTAQTDLSWVDKFEGSLGTEGVHPDMVVK